MKKIEKYGMESNCFTPAILTKNNFSQYRKEKKKTMRSVVGGVMVNENAMKYWASSFT
jgi:hypothetical protein